MTAEHHVPALPTRRAGLRLRLELFVEDLERSVAWYVDVLGFRRVRGDGEYVSLRRGDVVLGLGPVAKLPPEDPSRGQAPDRPAGHTQERVRRGPGAGVEIVLELDDVADVEAAAERVATQRWPLAAPLTDQPWGLRDFRVLDPDGYYLRITHGDAAIEAGG